MRATWIIAAIVVVLVVAVLLLVRSCRITIRPDEWVMVQAASPADATRLMQGCGIARAEWDASSRNVTIAPGNSLAARQCVADRDSRRHLLALPRFVSTTIAGAS